MNTVTIWGGVGAGSNSVLYDFFFHLELSFHSYPCNCIFGQICSFWRTCQSLATTKSWDVGPSSCCLGQESGKHAIFPEPEFPSTLWSQYYCFDLPEHPFNSAIRANTNLVLTVSTYTSALGGHLAFIAVRKASTEVCHPSFQRVVKAGFLPSRYAGESDEC